MNNSTAANQQEADFQAAHSYIQGIDVCHWQGEIDWSQVASDSVQFAFLKVSEGTSGTDGRAAANARGASNYGLHFGYYHFADPSAGDAEKECQNFLAAIEATGIAPTLATKYMLDLEVNAARLSPEQYELWVENFISHLNLTGPGELLIYGSPSFLDENLPEDHTLGAYPLWVAQYAPIASPAIPKGWSDWTVWQHSARGLVKGIVPHVCLDRAKADFLGAG